MNIDKIKSMIEANMNKRLEFRLNGSRNQIEEFSGYIVNVYKSVFIIKSINSDVIRSFSYSDILIGNLEILKY